MFHIYLVAKDLNYPQVPVSLINSIDVIAEIPLLKAIAGENSRRKFLISLLKVINGVINRKALVER